MDTENRGKPPALIVLSSMDEEEDAPNMTAHGSTDMDIREEM